MIQVRAVDDILVLEHWVRALEHRYDVRAFELRVHGGRLNLRLEWQIEALQVPRPSGREDFLEGYRPVGKNFFCDGSTESSPDLDLRPCVRRDSVTIQPPHTRLAGEARILSQGIRFSSSGVRMVRIPTTPWAAAFSVFAPPE